MPKAILVTDSEWVRNDVHASLSIGGWTVFDVDDPEQVLEVISDRNPHVVVSDLQVGAMGGMAIIRAIRGTIAEDERPRTVLLLDRSADTFIARRAGADAHVIKPFTAHALRDAIGPFPEEPTPVTSLGRGKARRKSAPRAG